MLPAGLSIEALEALLKTWRRRLIAAAIAFVCAIAIFVHAIAAARLALEPVVGLVGARLILVGVFVLIIAAAVGGIVLTERRAAELEAARLAADKSTFGAQGQVAAIIEALFVGYGLARGVRNGKASAAASEAAMAGDQAAPTDDAARPH